MPQTVHMTIELKPGQGAGVGKHLKIQSPPTVNLTGDQEVEWQVSVQSTGPTSVPTTIGLTAVTLWFPHVSPLFIQSSANPIPVREVTILVGQKAKLTLNPIFDRGALGTSSVPFRIPFAIYCTVDGGQSDTEPPNHGLHQRGRQMIDGHHSHPECNVGP